MDELEKYYNKFNEDKRLLSRHGQVEFTIAMKYIHEAIGDRKGLDIVDIGAGTGRYSVVLAEEGHNVTAVEYVKKNVSQIKMKSDKVVTKHGSALKLKLEDESFDIALLFGPTYHLFSHEDKLKAIKETKRVVRKGGIILIMYLTNEYAVITYAFKEGNLQKVLKEGKLDELLNKSENYSRLLGVQARLLIDVYKFSGLNISVTDGKFNTSALNDKPEIKAIFDILVLIKINT